MGEGGKFYIHTCVVRRFIIRLMKAKQYLISLVQWHLDQISKQAHPMGSE